MRRARNPLAVVSSLRVARVQSDLHMQASFGHLRHWMRVLAVFLIGLCVALGALFTVLFAAETGVRTVMLLTVVPFLPWLLLVPLVGWSARYITRRHLDHLADELGAVSRVDDAGPA